jgi:ribosome-binding factor A
MKKNSLFSQVSNLSSPVDKPQKSLPAPKAKPDFREIEQLVGEIRPDDGIDPRDEAKRRMRAMGAERPGFTHGVHKEEQFLSQVQSAIDSALHCAREPILNELAVRDVVKQGGTLAVVVTPQLPESPVDLQAARDALEKAASMLTREVASSITRKEAPKLSFVVLPAEAQKIER